MPQYLLLVNYDGGWPQTPMPSWGPDDIKAHLAYYDALNRELTASGELVQSHILGEPEAAKVVRSDGRGELLVTDGPFAETREVLAGYEMIDVESLERAIEIVARLSAVPGPGGAPTRQPIEVRQVVAGQAANL